MTWFFGNRKSLILTVILALALGLGIRFYDLTDLPLDFAPTRQLFSALKARGMYFSMLPEGANPPGGSSIAPWQREMAIKQWHSIPLIEPTVLESLTALTYRLVGEHLWIARVYSSLFWVLAGIFLFLLAQEIAGPSGALVAMLFYLFLPTGVIASRSFQPDPLMVAMIVTSAWAGYRWANRRTWKWALAAGLLTGLTLYIKNVAFFPLAFALVALVFEYGLLKSLKDPQTWVLAALSILPVAVYTVLGYFGPQDLNSQFAFRFFPQLWTQPAFYLRWKGQIEGFIGFGAFVVAFAGIFVARRRAMAFLAGLWTGYFAYGMTFAYHITSHDYYQLMLIPIVALSLAPVAETLFEKASQLRNLPLARLLLGGLIVLMLALQLWDVRVELVREDWRPEAAFWAALGQKLGNNGPVLTIAPDYGYRLAYWGWQDVDSWYDSADLNLRSLDGRQINLMQRFQERAAGKHFLVVTQLGKLDQQPEIKAYVFKTYPIFAQDKDYIIFDLTKTN